MIHMEDIHNEEMKNQFIRKDEKLKTGLLICWILRRRHDELLLDFYSFWGKKKKCEKKKHLRKKKKELKTAR